MSLREEVCFTDRETADNFTAFFRSRKVPVRLGVRYEMIESFLILGRAGDLLPLLNEHRADSTDSEKVQIDKVIANIKEKMENLHLVLCEISTNGYVRSGIRVYIHDKAMSDLLVRSHLVRTDRGRYFSIKIFSAEDIRVALPPSLLPDLIIKPPYSRQYHLTDCTIYQVSVDPSAVFAPDFDQIRYQINDEFGSNLSIPIQNFIRRLTIKRKFAYLLISTIEKKRRISREEIAVVVQTLSADSEDWDEFHFDFTHDFINSVIDDLLKMKILTEYKNKLKVSI